MRMEPIRVLSPRPVLQTDPAPSKTLAPPRDEYRPASTSNPTSVYRPLPAHRPAPRKEALEKEREQQDGWRPNRSTPGCAPNELWSGPAGRPGSRPADGIQRIFQEVLIRRRKVHDAILANWHKVLIG